MRNSERYEVYKNHDWKLTASQDIQACAAAVSLRGSVVLVCWSDWVELNVLAC